MENGPNLRGTDIHGILIAQTIYQFTDLIGSIVLVL